MLGDLQGHQYVKNSQKLLKIEDKWLKYVYTVNGNPLIRFLKQVLQKMVLGLFKGGKNGWYRKIQEI